MATIMALTGHQTYTAPVPAPAPISQNLGATFTVDTPVALFATSLASPITSASNSMTLVSGLTGDGTTLASSTYSFIIDEGQSDQEFVRADCTNTACTNMARGLSLVDGSTTIASLAQPHRRGQSVKITDAPLLLVITKIINGGSGFPNVISYASPVAISTSSNQIPYAQWIANSYVDKFTAQSILGTKTFGSTTTFTATSTYSSASVVLGYDPTNTNDAATKHYVDTIAIAGAPNASTVTKGISTLSVAPVSPTSPIAVGDNDPRLAGFVTQLSTTTTFTLSTTTLNLSTTTLSSKNTLTIQFHASSTAIDTIHGTIPQLQFNSDATAKYSWASDQGNGSYGNSPSTNSIALDGNGAGTGGNTYISITVDNTPGLIHNGYFSFTQSAYANRQDITGSNAWVRGTFTWASSTPITSVSIGTASTTQVLSTGTYLVVTGY